MEKHKCKLCSRTFSNGRALGGHMKAHLGTLPLPPPNPLSSSSESESESESETEQNHHHHKTLIYGLRENPKKSFKVSHPAGDRDSETESNNIMTTRQRSKRNRSYVTPNLHNHNNDNNKMPKPKLMSFVPEPVLSSVSDASTEEDVAMCLMMLSRGTWKKNKKNTINAAKQDQEEEHQHDDVEIEKVKNVVVTGKKKKKKNKCEGCGKTFRSSRALGSHRSICCRAESGTAAAGGGGGGERVFKCPFCFKVFGSGQALGGHKRSHLMGISATTSSSIVNDSVMMKNSRERFIDLNLPAPVDDDDGELSVVSDA